MFEQFVEFQNRILAIAARSETVLESGQRDVAALSAARWEIARTLREYQLFKHIRIFDPLLGRNDYRGCKAERMKAECIQFGERFRDHVLKWSVVSILDHWDEYQPAALATIGEIRKQLARERSGVAVLLDVKLAA
jgi:hypothetical protein